MNANTLRVVFISDAITDRNGVGTYYRDLVSYLSDQLEYVELIAPTLGNRSSHQGFSFRIPGDQTQRLFFPRMGWIKSYLNRIKPHIVVFPTLGPYSVFSVRHAQKCGARVCIGQHTDFEQLASLCFNRFVAPVVRTILQNRNRSLLKKGAMIVTNNPETRSQLEQFGPVRIIGTPIPKSFVEQPTLPVSRRLEKVLFLGRLSPEKNIDKLIDASAELANIQFSIGGDGPLRSVIEERSTIQENIRCLGWLNRTQVMKVIDECDLLVLPSTIESFGTVAMEALLRERNAMVSASCGINNWPGLANNLFVWQDDESLGDAIRRAAATSYETRKHLAENGRIAAKQLNSETIGQWLEIFDEMTQDVRRDSQIRRAV